MLIVGEPEICGALLVLLSVMLKELVEALADPSLTIMLMLL